MPRPEVFWTSCVAVTSAGVRPLRTHPGMSLGKGEHSVERTDNIRRETSSAHRARGPHDRDGDEPRAENAYGSHRHLRAPPGTTQGAGTWEPPHHLGLVNAVGLKHGAGSTNASSRERLPGSQH